MNNQNTKEAVETDASDDEKLDGLADAEAFGELKEISEKLHSALHHFKLDSTVVEITKEKIPEAVSGLDFVIEKTHEAANKTLDLVEDSMPLASDLGARARALHTDWQQFRRREMDFDQFIPMAEALSVFLGEVGEMSQKLSSNLSEILLAQEFQDLTGQVIRRVMEDVKTVDEELSKIAEKTGVSSAPREAKPIDPTVGRGPVIDASAEQSVVSDQCEVDDILSDLDL